MMKLAKIQFQIMLPYACLQITEALIENYVKKFLLIKNLKYIEKGYINWDRENSIYFWNEIKSSTIIINIYI